GMPWSTSWPGHAPCRWGPRSSRRASRCSTRSSRRWVPSSRRPVSPPSRKRSGSPMPKFEVVPILELVRETPTTMTYRFRGDFGGQPGQFLMVWIPRYDELPMAISYLGAVKGITVHDYGDATHAFATFSAGELRRGGPHRDRRRVPRLRRIRTGPCREARRSGEV